MTVDDLSPVVIRGTDGSGGKGTMRMGMAVVLVATLVWSAGSGLVSAQEDVPWPDDGGFRMTRYKAPTPRTVPGAERVDAARAKTLIDAGLALPIDVMPAGDLLTPGLDGEWLVVKPRRTLPGALWWPDLGRGALTAAQEAAFAERLAAIDHAQAPLFFCLRACWMSWNAAKRAADLDVSPVYWFADGTDGWAEMGFSLEDGVPVGPAWPLPTK